MYQNNNSRVVDLGTIIKQIATAARMVGRRNSTSRPAPTTIDNGNLDKYLDQLHILLTPEQIQFLKQDMTPERVMAIVIHSEWSKREKEFRNQVSVDHIANLLARMNWSDRFNTSK